MTLIAMQCISVILITASVTDEAYTLDAEDTSDVSKGTRKAKRTGRYEAHIWQEGKQIYLGGFDAEEQAALAYDLAALKFRGTDAQTNYDKCTYEQEMLQFDEVTKEEVVQTLRRQSKGFQKTSSQYRGVTRHQKGKWEARIGQMVGKKYKYLGLFTTELEAAQAYDRESVTRKGVDAITNFDLSHYTELLSSEDVEEATRRGLLSAPEMATADESAGLVAWQGVPDQELDSMTTLLEGTLGPASVAQQGLMTIDNWADPPLRGYSSMPAMQTLPEDYQLDSFAGALSQAKYAMPDGITPKSVFEWQLPSGTASPSTPQHDLVQTTPYMPAQGWILQHLEAEILSSGGVLKPYTAIPDTSSTSIAMRAEEGAPLEDPHDQSHLAFLLGDEWMQGLQNKE
ncbi:g10341 [Coccomyxa viridis]|uniref:G10341 protein n=1 Tax=Coccomyxa viridis TaxID=1274662 RepID=A0ABP1G9Q2_9CHLO